MSAEIISLSERRPHHRAIRFAATGEQIAALAALQFIGLTLEHLSAADWPAAHESAQKASQITARLAGVEDEEADLMAKLRDILARATPIRGE